MPATCGATTLRLVGKAHPHNASHAGTVAARRRSLERPGIDRVDLPVPHWRGQHRLRETVAGMHAPVAAGEIGNRGVSHFDADDLDELAAIAPGKASGDRACALNRVYDSVSKRGPGFSLLPWMRARGVPPMAYSPIDQARGRAAAQVALACAPTPTDLACTPQCDATPTSAKPTARITAPCG